MEQPERADEEKETTHKLLIQYRGQLTEDYMRALKRINAPCKVILTLET